MVSASMAGSHCTAASRPRRRLSRWAWRAERPAESNCEVREHASRGEKRGKAAECTRVPAHGSGSTGGGAECGLASHTLGPLTCSHAARGRGAARQGPAGPCSGLCSRPGPEAGRAGVQQRRRLHDGCLMCALWADCPAGWRLRAPAAGGGRRPATVSTPLLLLPNPQQHASTAHSARSPTRGSLGRVPHFRPCDEVGLIAPGAQLLHCAVHQC